MAKYRVVEPSAVIQGGRAWQVGDVVDLTDKQAADLGGMVERESRVDRQERVALETVAAENKPRRKPEPEGNGE